MYYPPELVNLDQWMVARGGEKKPWSVNTGAPEDDQNPSNWTSFSKAHQTVMQGDADHVGFCFVPENKIYCIDIDNHPERNLSSEAVERQSQVVEYFGADTYIETSLSYTLDNPCYHILRQGTIPRNINKDGIQLIHQRFVIITGRCFDEREIANGHSYALEQLVAKLGGVGPLDTPSQIYYDDTPIKETTEQILNRMRASEWGKLDHFLQGAGRSEDDYALYGFIHCYTQNREQMLEVFRSFPHAQRLKSDGSQLTDYHMNHTLDKFLGEQTRKAMPVQSYIASGPLDLGQLEQKPKDGYQLTVPTGLTGKLAQYCYSSAPSPMMAVAVAGALSMMAGICGRAFVTPTPSPMGLSLYLMMLARTGFGKEAANTMMKRLLGKDYIARMTPGSSFDGRSSKFVGPKLISANGLQKYMAESSWACFTCYDSEFGVKLKELSFPKLSTADATLKHFLLTGYSENHPHGEFSATSHSTKDLRAEGVKFPAMTILGASTPTVFFDALTPEMVTGGLLPRMLVVQHEDTRPEYNKAAIDIPPLDLVEALNQLVIASLTNQSPDEMHGKAVRVGWIPEAEAILDTFRVEAMRLADTGGQIADELWSRAFMNAVKIGSLLAVGDNWNNPCMSVQNAKWAVDFVRHCVNKIYEKFETGEATGGEAARRAELMRILRDYFEKGPTQSHIKKIKGIEMMRENGIVPYAYLVNKVQRVAAFANTREESYSKELLKLCRSFVDEDVMAPVTKQSDRQQLGVSGTTQLWHVEVARL